MLTKAFTLVLVMLIGLALGFETAHMVHGQSSTTGLVNIHLAVLAGVLLAVLWVSRTWLARQWTRFTVWLELTLDGLSNAAIIASMERRLAGVPLPGTPDCEACAQDALDDAAKTTCSGCGKRGHWSPDCPGARTPNAALPCRGCSWCGKDPGDLPDELWTECDGSGYLPDAGAERKRPPSRTEGKQPDGS